MPRALAAGLALALLATPAAADPLPGAGDWPLAVIERPLTLAPGMIEVRGDTLGVSLSADAVGKPIFAAPDVAYGVTHSITVGLTHLTGLCLTGTSGRCPKAYNDVGLEATVGILRAETASLAAHVGFAFASFDPLIGGAVGGARLRVGAGKVAVVLDPTIYVGALGRDELYLTGGLNDGPKETLHVPVEVQVQATPTLAAIVASGVDGPLDGFGDRYVVPVGVGATYAVTRRLDVGGEVRLYYAKAALDHELDTRYLFLRAALRI
jgi:hypothetical protein